MDAQRGVSRSEALCVHGAGVTPSANKVAASLQRAAQSYRQVTTVFQAARATATDCAFQISFCECRYSTLECAADLMRILCRCRGQARIDASLGLLPRVYNDLSRVFAMYKNVATSHFDMDEQSIAVLKSHQDAIVSIMQLVYL